MAFAMELSDTSMACSTTMLTDAKIKAAKAGDKDFRLGDSGQLYLQVTKAGGRLWRMNYTFGLNAQGKTKQKTLSFGAYPAVPLSQSRAKRAGEEPARGRAGPGRRAPIRRAGA